MNCKALRITKQTFCILLALIFIIIFSPTFNVQAANKASRLRNIKVGKTVNLNAFGDKVRITLIKSSVSNKSYKYDIGMRQRVVVKYKVTFPKIVNANDYISSSTYDEKDFYGAIYYEVLNYSNGKPLKTVYYPASQSDYIYYTNKKYYNDGSLKSTIVCFNFLKKPSQTLAVGILGTDGIRGSATKLPSHEYELMKKGKVTNWYFNKKNKNYSVFTKVK